MNIKLSHSNWQWLCRISVVGFAAVGVVIGIWSKPLLMGLLYDWYLFLKQQTTALGLPLYWLIGLGALGVGMRLGVAAYFSLVENLSRRRRLEQQLQASETKLNAILNSAIASIVSFRLYADSTWEYDYWSAGCANVFGFTASEFMGDRNLWWSRLLPEHRQAVLAAWTDLADGKIVQYDYRFHHKDGSWRWIHSVMSPQHYDRANCWVVTAVDTDITQPKQIEQALRESQKDLEKIASTIPQILYLFDVQHGISTYLNQQSNQILGYSPEEICAGDFQWLMNHFHPEDRHLGLDLSERFAHLTDTDVLSTEYRFRHKNGDWRWLNTREVVFNRDEQGAPHRILGVVQDITDRKHSEETLQRQAKREQLLRRITQRIHQSLELDEILKATVDEVRQALQADRAIIFRLRPDHSGQVIEESVLPDYPVTNQLLWQDECFPPECYDFYRQGNPRIVLDITTDDWGSCLVDYMQSIGVQSKMVAPITHPTPTSPRVWGLLIVHACTEQRVWQPSEAEFLQQIANQLAIAIYQADLYQQAQAEIVERQKAQFAAVQAMEREQQLREQERLISSIAHNIRQFLDLDYILSTTAEEVRRFLQVDRVVVYRFRSNWQGEIIAESVVDDTLSLYGQVFSDPCFETMLPAYRQGRIHAVQDIESASLDRCYVQMLKPLQVRAVLAIPILVDQELWGLLIAHHSSPHPWQHVGWYLLRQLGTQLAIGIHQAELYEQLQQLNSNLEGLVQERTVQLQQSLDFEALLKRITDKVRDSLDEQQILQAAVQELAIGLGTYSCDTGLYQLEAGISYISCEYVTNQASAVTQKTILMSDYEELYSVLLRGEYLYFCWYPQYPNLIRDVFQHRTVLAYPLIDDQGVIGDLWLYKSETEGFSESEIRLVQQVANQCAIALRQSRLYQAAQTQVAELEKLNRLKDDFLSTVSHELRTPMSNIKMSIQLLEMQLQAAEVLNPKGNTFRYFNILREECQREIHLIDDLLDLTRLDSDTEPHLLSTIQLQAFIPYIAEPFWERANNQQQQLIVSIPENLPPLVTDVSYLERAITELLNNACKYTPAHEQIRVSAGMTNSNSDAPLAMTQRPLHEIRITNTGTEIAPAECDRIFDKFYRIPNSDPWRYGGTGLGLALVKKLATRLDGSIQVESSHHQTTFILQCRSQDQDLSDSP